MPLVRPLVIGPLSTISRNVRVRGQLTGATVSIVSLGPSRRRLAAGLADSGDTRIVLDPGESLKPDDVLYAVQSLGVETSRDPSPGDPLGVPVQAAPTTPAGLSAVSFYSTLFTCGRALWLRGGVPGALGHVRHGGTDVGAGTFEDAEGARFGIAPMLTGGSVQALQSIPGVGDGPAVSRTPLALPGPPRGPLAAPDILPPPVACNTSVKVTEVFDGAEVTIHRDDGVRAVDLLYMFDAPTLHAPLGPALVDGEMLTVSQAVHAECSRTPTERSIRVAAAPPIPKPRVRGPLCPETALVVIDDLVPGAGIEVFANGKTYRAQTPTDATSLRVVLDPLEAPPPGQTRVVTARQEQCGIFGPNSDPVSVDPLSSAPPAHQILPPLLACSPIVRVADAHPNATLTAFSDVLGPISGFVTAEADGTAVIAVAPQLIAGHTIEVLQSACGGSPTRARRMVESTERLSVPSVGEVFIGRKTVEIGDLVPGTRVEVVVTAKDGTVREVASFIAEDKSGPATVQGSFQGGDKVKARQGLCSVLTGFSVERTASVEPIQQDWWRWPGANPRNEVWDEDYVVSGSFTNKGGTPIQDFEVTIFEDAANVGSTGHPLVSPGQSVPGATAPMKKDWKWFLEGVWVVKGPTNKTFRYKASIAAKDVDGNPYPSVSSVDLVVIVNVPKWKRTAGAYSMGMAISAAAMAASIFLIIAAGVAYGLAAIAGAVALDPPEPDTNFAARIPLPRQRRVSRTAPGRELIRVFRIGERIMAIQLAKSLMEGRRLGAVAAGQDQWAAIHASDIAVATRLQQRLGREVARLAPEARRAALELIPPGTDLEANRRALQASGLTPAMARRMRLDAPLRAGFDALLRSDTALTDPDIGAALDESIAALQEFADSLA